jgi:hypothetical protein
MVDETSEPEDIASLMEALWGERASIPEDDPPGPVAEKTGEEHGEARAETGPASATVPPGGKGNDAFTAYLDAALADQRTWLRHYVDAAIAAGLQQGLPRATEAVDGHLAAMAARMSAVESDLRTELAWLVEIPREAEALDARVCAAVAEHVAAVRAEAVDAAEALVADAEARLVGRLDEIAAAIAEVSERSAAASTAQQESAERLSTIELQERVNLEMVRVRESIAAIRTELSGKVAALETGLTQWAADWRAEVDGRLAGIVREIGQAPADAGRRSRGKRRIRRAELERLVESIAGWRAQSVGQEELAALRRDLKAELEHRFAVLDAVPTDTDSSTEVVGSEAQEQAHPPAG